MSDRVLVVDDHNLIFNGLKIVLGNRFSVDYGKDLSSAIELIKDKKYRTIIIDITIGDEKGFDLVKYLEPEQQFFFLSMHKSSYYINKAKTLGANGYFLKDEPVEIILQAMDRDSSDFFMSEEVENELTNDVNNQPTNYDKLTPREQQIFLLLAEGSSYKQIAYDLNISSKTVNNHRTNIMKKLEITSLPELIKEAIAIGIV